MYRTKKDFDELRSLRNPDGTWWRIYFYETNLSGDFMTSLSAIGEALKRNGRELGVDGICNGERQRTTTGL